MKKIISACLTVLLLLGLTMVHNGKVEAAGVSKTMYTKASTSVESSPSSRARRLKSLKKGTAVKVYYRTQRGGFYQARIANKNGWIPKSRVSDTLTVKTNHSQRIGYATVKQSDSTLPKGQTRVARNGKTGARTVTYQKVYRNGRLVQNKTISNRVTRKPISKIIKVGTKSVSPPKPVSVPAPTYLPALQATSMLSSSGLFSVSGSTYHIADNFGLMIETNVGNDYVSSIFFDGTTYYSIKNSSEQDCIDALGPVEGPQEYEAGLQEMHKIESALMASANAVYGPGTAQANELYNKLLTDGKSPNGAYVTFH